MCYGKEIASTVSKKPGSETNHVVKAQFKSDWWWFLYHQKSPQCAQLPMYPFTCHYLRPPCQLSSQTYSSLPLITLPGHGLLSCEILVLWTLIPPHKKVYKVCHLWLHLWGKFWSPTIFQEDAEYGSEAATVFFFFFWNLSFFPTLPYGADTIFFITRFLRALLGLQ